MKTVKRPDEQIRYAPYSSNTLLRACDSEPHIPPWVCATTRATTTSINTWWDPARAYACLITSCTMLDHRTNPTSKFILVLCWGESSVKSLFASFVRDLFAISPRETRISVHNKPQKATCARMRARGASAYIRVSLSFTFRAVAADYYATKDARSRYGSPPSSTGARGRASGAVSDRRTPKSWGAVEQALLSLNSTAKNKCQTLQPSS